MGLCARETQGREGGWVKTRNRAFVARFRAHHVKRRWGQWVGVLRWHVQGGGGGGGGLCARETQGRWGKWGFGPKSRNQAAMAPVAWTEGSRGGVLWGYRPPSCANLGSGDG